MKMKLLTSLWRNPFRNPAWAALLWIDCDALLPLSLIHIWGVCSRAAVRGLDNVKVFRVESRYFLEWMMQPGCISRLHSLCPDPWPKERHHKNRLVQEDFLPVLHRSLSDGGEFLFKTDHEGYFLWVLDLSLIHI